MKKYSVTINGHRTSLSLEENFWHALEDMARQKQISVQKLICDIDHTRLKGLSELPQENLSSAVRGAVLQFYRDMLSKM